MEPNPAATYELVIDEAQRQYLITALEQCRLQGYYGADAEVRSEIDLLWGCLSVAEPGVTNDCTL